MFDNSLKKETFNAVLFSASHPEQIFFSFFFFFCFCFNLDISIITSCQSKLNVHRGAIYTAITTTKLHLKKIYYNIFLSFFLNKSEKE